MTCVTLIVQDHDADGTGVVDASKVPSLVRRILEAQRKTLSDIIAEQNHTKEDLLEGVASWIPRWKQWGVDLEMTLKKPCARSGMLNMKRNAAKPVFWFLLSIRNAFPT